MTGARPDPDALSEFFWTSGRDGRLRFLRCSHCRAFVHPPSSRCPHCLTATLLPEAVSGRGRVDSYTVVVGGAGDAPTVVAWVSLPEQDDLRVTASLRGVGPQDARIGMEVQVTFEIRGGYHVPVFEPAPTGEPEAR